jgi:ankyrin repeat protein
VNAKNLAKETPLHLAKHYNREKIINMLIKAGANTKGIKKII